MPVGNDSASAFAHLEQRVSYLLERLEASADHRAGNLGRVEDGLQDILRHLETQHANFAALTASGRSVAAAPDNGLVDIVKRELSDIRFSQSETDRHTQDSLEAVHNTLGHVVDRLAMIEGDLRAVRSAPVAPAAPQRAAPPAPQARRAAHRRRRAAMPPQPKPELPNPAAAQHFPGTFCGSAPGIPRRAAGDAGRRRGAESHQRNSGAAQPRRRVPRSSRNCRPITRSNPGHGRPGGRLRHRSALPLRKARSAKFRRGPKEPVSATNFIAAARRAAQAAAAAPPAGKAARGPQKNSPATRPANPRPLPPRFARCWLAPAWSSSCSARSRWR